jgi:alkylation response protein AidB-like acyl-CoA dehydrogenase
MNEFGDMYRPSEEHEAFRAAVREICDEKVAPNAAEADELAEFPKASFMRPTSPRSTQVSVPTR